MKIKKTFLALLISMIAVRHRSLKSMPQLESNKLDRDATITMVSGGIVDPDALSSHQYNRLRDYQVRYSGFSCRTEQNGLFHFFCKKQSLFDPIFILISNGNYLVSKEDAIGDRSFVRLSIKQDPAKEYLFFKSRIENDNLYFDKHDLEQYCFELPSERTVVINLHPDYVEDSLDSSKNFFFHDRCIMLPSIKLKPQSDICRIKYEKWKKKGINHRAPKKRVMQRLQDKTCLRKFKQFPHHEEIEFKQAMKIKVSPRRNSYILLSRSAEGEI